MQTLCEELELNLDFQNTDTCVACTVGIEHNSAHSCMSRSREEVVKLFFDDCFGLLSSEKIVESVRVYLKKQFLNQAKLSSASPDSTTSSSTTK